MGRVKLKVLPLPTTLSAQMRPPWASMMPLAMLRPRPAPPEARDFADYARNAAGSGVWARVST